MDCDVVKDLIPLYVDTCCSEKSAALVAAHLKSCPQCRRMYESMGSPCTPLPAAPEKACLHPIRTWKASLLQSFMLFVSFAVMAVGVVLEGNTPTGKENGLWAVALIVPASGYLLSVANWFFVRLYKNRRQFSLGSCLTTGALTTLGYLWAALHYADALALTLPFILLSLGLSTVFCMLSKVLSSRYALLLGKE